MKYVHNLGCFAARCLWSYSLGNLTLRTSAFWIWIPENIKKTHDTHVCIFFLYLYISLEKTQTINKCARVHAAYMYVWMYGKIQINKFWMKYVHNLGCFAARCLWSYSLGNLTLRTSVFEFSIKHPYIHTCCMHTCTFIDGLSFSKDMYKYNTKKYSSKCYIHSECVYIFHSKLCLFVIFHVCTNTKKKYIYIYIHVCVVCVFWCFLEFIFKKQRF